MKTQVKLRHVAVLLWLLGAVLLQALNGGAQPVTRIGAGSVHSLFLRSDGSLWAMGNNGYGQLGDGTTDGGSYSTNLPELIVSSNVTTVAGAYYHTLFLKGDGSLWAMGWSQFGQLGDGTYNYDTNQPEEIVSNNVTAVAGGYYHSLFLKSDGSLWAMGGNSSGQLGDGSLSNAYRSEEIVSNNVTAIAAGGFHSLFLTRDGSLWAMGQNSLGQLGDGTTDNGNYYTNRPEQIAVIPPGYNQIVARLLSDGDVSLSYVGIAGTNYALDRSFNLAPANWVPQATNPAGAGGVLVLTNTPDAATNNFWRIRRVQE
jgi:alpha-tubulin suppressor-like RCC1 family protein